MKISYGKVVTKFGTGVKIKLTGDEVASAIDLYLYSQGAIVSGARTVTVNEAYCKEGGVYVDPPGQVIYKGKRFSGRGPENK